MIKKFLEWLGSPVIFNTRLGFILYIIASLWIVNIIESIFKKLST